jgi:uncharacterized membrane protein
VGIEVVVDWFYIKPLSERFRVQIFISIQTFIAFIVMKLVQILTISKQIAFNSWASVTAPM